MLLHLNAFLASTQLNFLSRRDRIEFTRVVYGDRGHSHALVGVQFGSDCTTLTILPFSQRILDSLQHNAKEFDTAAYGAAATMPPTIATAASPRAARSRSRHRPHASSFATIAPSADAAHLIDTELHSESSSRSGHGKHRLRSSRQRRTAEAQSFASSPTQTEMV